jgi:hypothetical protein
LRHPRVARERNAVAIGAQTPDTKEETTIHEP